MPTLTTPSTLENLWTRDRLFGRYRLDRGVTLCVQGSTVKAVQYELQENLEGDTALYDHVYKGGHIYTITQAEADVLIAAGYGAYIS